MKSTVVRDRCGGIRPHCLLRFPNRFRSVYGAAGGMRVKILAPAYTSPAKVAQVRAYGAEVQLVEGPREESQNEAIRQSAQIFYASHNWQPFFLQGTKSIAYELWEDFNFEVPDNIIVPVGAGSTLLGCHIGFGELLAAGQIRKLPRLFAAQPLNCSPLDASFKAGVDTPVPRPVHKTIAEGTAIAHPLRLREMIHALKETAGETVAVSEDEIVAALKRLARLGLFAEPTSAGAAAALAKLIEQKVINARERTVVLISGTGIKTASTIAELFEQQ
jgi:threonine synthase